MKINRKKLPVKYALEIYQDLDGYPSHQDLEYLVVSTLEEAYLLTSNFTADKIWSGLKMALGTQKDLIRFLDYLSEDKDTSEFSINLIKTSANSYKLEAHNWQ